MTSLRALKWIAVVVPILFLAGADVLRRTVFSDQPYVFIVAVVLFSLAILAVIGRLQHWSVIQNRQLTALLAVGRSAASSLDVDE
ncbi:MAG: hypothetical protein IH956_06905, partial [Chloroflexi bacterium]|nr:hypothetical protein [Chloroflexota bacterium]